ncbi:hypothetical protein, partial [Roseovarius sp.]|uniref:hypothetical protein n=1 Tax=Roseovarius sp. TaxID=1486281 RepID=UPI00356284B3
ERLHVSWVGRSIRDNSEIPPSVLVGQLRDALAAGWVVADAETNADEGEQPEDAGQQLVAHLTTEHPLQPFSREYFRPEQQRLRTYASEWGEVWQQRESDIDPARATDANQQLAVESPDRAIQLRELTEFYRQPVSVFMRRRLRVNLGKGDDIGPPPEDEPFKLNALEEWQLRDELLKRLMLEKDAKDIDEVLEKRLNEIRLEGRLPMAAPGEKLAGKALKEAQEIGNRYFEECDRHGPALNPCRVNLSFDMDFQGVDRIAIQDWLSNLRGNENAVHARVELLASKIGTARAPAWDKLARFWPEHLAGCAMGLTMKTIIVGQDKTLGFDPVMQETAAAWFRDLARDWLIAQSRPLPVTPKASGAYLKVRASNPDEPEKEWIDEAMKKARDAYVGNSYNPGVLVREPALARLYPDFEALQGSDDDGFMYWSDRVYGAMVETFLGQGGK